MEIGHNVMHGQWDWLRDPKIHSSAWEWDNVSSAEGWKHSHNFQHHTFTNVVGKDRDLGYEIMRIDPEQPWHPVYLAQPIYNLVLAALFEWGVALHDIELDEVRRGRKPWSAAKKDLKRLARKAHKQVIKDYVVWPALSGPSAAPALLGSLSANLVRNVWTHAIIFCGHFPDGAETFDYAEQQLEDETRGGWYVRQLLGSANLDGGQLFHIMAGNLSFQIEHHLFPDVPSNRYRDYLPTRARGLRALRPALHQRTALPAVQAGADQDRALCVPGWGSVRGARAVRRGDGVGGARRANAADHRRLKRQLESRGGIVQRPWGEENPNLARIGQNQRPRNIDLRIGRTSEVRSCCPPE
jgi:fatty acid desaturase